MPERYTDRVHTEHAVLDIGEDVGALVIYCRPELRGRQIDVSLRGCENAAPTIVPSSPLCFLL
jgi:hypothetical protein